MLSNGNSFANGQSLDLGTGDSHGSGASDGTRPSAAWLFKVVVFRL